MKEGKGFCVSMELGLRRKEEAFCIETRPTNIQNPQSKI